MVCIPESMFNSTGKWQSYFQLSWTATSSCDTRGVSSTLVWHRIYNCFCDVEMVVFKDLVALWWVVTQTTTLSMCFLFRFAYSELLLRAGPMGHSGARPFGPISPDIFMTSFPNGSPLNLPRKIQLSGDLSYHLTSCRIPIKWLDLRWPIVLLPLSAMWTNPACQFQ